MPSKKPPSPALRNSMAKDYQQQWEGVTNDADEAGAIRVMGEILATKDGRVFISRLGREEAELSIRILDNGITKHNLESTMKNAFFVALRRLAENHQLLPDRMKMKERHEVSDEIHVSGGFGDVRPQQYMGRRVAVKTAKALGREDLQKVKKLKGARKDKKLEEIQKTRKRFYREVVLWSTLFHPNILELVGAQEDAETGQFVTISEWMYHGTIMDYIEKHSVNRLELLHGAALGLEYLHNARLAHGDLKGANILMSNDEPPHACLADFGFITTVLSPDQNSSCSAGTTGGTARFMAPELLVPGAYDMTNPKATPQTDVYAFGLVIFQVLTGDIPLPEVPDTAIGHHVLEGRRPKKPSNASTIGFSDPLWGFTQRCWDGKIELRPEAGEVVTHLGEAATNWVGLMPPCVRARVGTPCSEEESSGHCRKFLPSASDVLMSATGLQTNPALLSPTSALSTQPTEPPKDGPQEVVTENHMELQLEPRVPTLRQRSEGQQFDQRHGPPQSQPSQTKREQSEH